MLFARLFNFIVETKLRSTLNYLGKSIFEITLENIWNDFFFIGKTCVESEKKKIVDIPNLFSISYIRSFKIFYLAPWLFS